METNLILALVAFVFVAVCLLSGKIAASVTCGTAVLFLWLTGVLTTERPLQILSAVTLSP